ncbi:hypothetical protein LCGC14_0781610, partial [marine sediment metagenome]
MIHWLRYWIVRMMQMLVAVLLLRFLRKPDPAVEYLGERCIPKPEPTAEELESIVDESIALGSEDKAEEPTAEEPTAEEPTAEEPTAEEPTLKEKFISFCQQRNIDFTVHGFYLDIVAHGRKYMLDPTPGIDPKELVV